MSIRESRINGIRFESPTLCLKFRNTKKVFIFVVTSGMELYEWSNTIKDMLENYWAIPVEMKYFGKKATILRNVLAFIFSFVVAIAIGVV